MTASTYMNEIRLSVVEGVSVNMMDVCFRGLPANLTKRFSGNIFKKLNTIFKVKVIFSLAMRIKAFFRAVFTFVQQNLRFRSNIKFIAVDALPIWRRFLEFSTACRGTEFWFAMFQARFQKFKSFSAIQAVSSNSRNGSCDIGTLPRAKAFLLFLCSAFLNFKRSLANTTYKLDSSFLKSILTNGGAKVILLPLNFIWKYFKGRMAMITVNFHRLEITRWMNACTDLVAKAAKEPLAIANVNQQQMLEVQNG